MGGQYHQHSGALCVAAKFEQLRCGGEDSRAGRRDTHRSQWYSTCVCSMYNCMYVYVCIHEYMHRFVWLHDMHIIYTYLCVSVSP